MPTLDDWARSLAEAAADVHDAPLRICALCVQVLGLSGGGVSVTTATGNRAVLCATDERSAHIEDLQFTLGEGPCVEAYNSGAPVLVPDLHDPVDVVVERWPAFLGEAERMGVRAVFALPLRIGAISIGAMDFYRDERGMLSPEALTACWSAADAIAGHVLQANLQPRGEAAEPSESALTYYVQVHQATGMVQAQLGVSTREALLRLRARAFADGRPLASVSRDVVDRRLRFAAEEGR